MRKTTYLNATGNPSFGLNIPIENGYISVSNGNVHLELPLAQRTQRGDLKLDERLVYDSRIWQAVDNSGNQSWQPTNVPNSMAGWRFVSGLPSAPTPTAQNYDLCDSYGDYFTYYSYSWTDNTGTPHLFDTAWDYIPDNCPETPSQETETGYATDSSGYSISLSGESDDNFPPSIIVYDNNGNEVYPKAVDRFGNYWSADGNGNLIDDLENTPVTMTPSGNQITYTILSFGGAQKTYTVTTEQIAVSTSFQQTGVSEFPPGTLTAIQSIQLPDQSGSYSFSYDSYGELAGMTLPSGGTVNLQYNNVEDSYYNENRWLKSYSGGHGSYSFSLTPISYCSSSQQSGCQEQTPVTDASGNQTYYGFTLNGGALNTNTAFYSGGSLLVDTATTYNTSLSCNWSWICPPGAAYVTPTSTTTNLNDAGLQTQTLYSYNPQLGKITSVKQWDYYTGSAPSSPAIDTEYTYTNSGYDLAQAQVLDGSGNQVSLTNYNFTGTATAPPAGILGYGAAPNATNIPSPYMGSIAQWAGGSNINTLTTALTSDEAGTLLSSTDPNGRTTFSHDATDTYITTVTPPTPSSGSRFRNRRPTMRARGCSLAPRIPTALRPPTVRRLGRPSRADQLPGWRLGDLYQLLPGRPRRLADDEWDDQYPASNSPRQLWAVQPGGRLQRAVGESMVPERLLL